MQKRKLWSALLIALPLSLVAGCGDRQDERAALEEDTLDRELDLALRKDTAPATFDDSGVAPEPEPEPTPAPQPKPAPAASRPRTPEPAPKPQPRREEPARPRTVTLTVPTGTTFVVQLDETLATDKNQPGDPFTATVHDPIVSVDGEILIPAGATVRGRVTAADKSNNVSETAVIKLAFESVSFGGRSYPLQATVVEANPVRRTRTTTRQSATKVAAGAAAGALLGQVLGKDTESTLKGAAAGAAAGTAIALGTADVDAELSAGSRMVIRLDAPVEVQSTTY